MFFNLQITSTRTCTQIDINAIPDWVAKCWNFASDRLVVTGIWNMGLSENVGYIPNEIAI